MEHGKGFDRRVALARVIEARIARLSPACRRLLALASVLGREVDVDVLERLAGPPGVHGLVREARSAGVFIEVPGDDRRLRFAHALVRDACYANLPSSLRASTHRKAAGVLDAMPEPGRHAAEIAHHLAAGARDEDRFAAGERFLLAVDGALRSLAFEEAARLCRRGLTVLGDPPPAGAAGLALRRRLLDALRVAVDRAVAPARTDPPSPS